MPIIDEERGVLVLRVVYDGPPMSGKTTSLKTLSKGLSTEIVTPAEQAGRTVYFDWVDYVGGLFDGRQIRCQIVGVPGQMELSDRRRHLLDSADAVVMVADTRPEAFDEALKVLRSLVPHCRGQDPPTGIVLQANKRDAEDALSREQVRHKLDRVAPIALVETVATTGDGVREAFVLAVRLALDRVRMLSARGAIDRGRPEVDAPDELLEELRSLENAGAHTVPVKVAASPTRANGSLRNAKVVRIKDEPPSASDGDDHSDDEIVFSPDPMMPGGFIWPPVDGRTLLHEVAAARLTPSRTSKGDWSASGGGWRLHSNANALYENADHARNALISWARLHAACIRELSAGRALILANAGSNRFRLWQLVRTERALREHLEDTHGEASPEVVAEQLAAATKLLARAGALSNTARLRLPWSLWTLGAASTALPTFVGLMPADNQSSGQPPKVSQLVEMEFLPLLRGILRDREDFDEIAAAVARLTRADAQPELQTLMSLTDSLCGSFLRGPARETDTLNTPQHDR